jgi:GH15 family glucan-1,4-alpha-glucosidase
MQILYGVTGTRRCPEIELPWLPGYAESRPVRIGNAAHEQLQIDVYGEVADALYLCRRAGLPSDENAWRLLKALMNFLESSWDKPDDGIWEVRGERRHFTHSKMMAWVAFDRAIKFVERVGHEGPVDRWRAQREELHAQVCRKGYDAEQGAFVQHYGSKELDASLLMMPLVGFLPATDPRFTGTVRAIEERLMRRGFVDRYRSGSGVDGLPTGEGVFLPCSFWLVDCLYLMGRVRDAQRLFESLLALRNDVGLLAEEYDPDEQRQLGNFPQAFSHVSLVNSAFNLAPTEGPAEHRLRG